MHVHIALLWTIVLGILGSILGGAVTHMFSPPDEPRDFIRPGLSSQLVRAILVLFCCYKLKIHFPSVR